MERIRADQPLRSEMLQTSKPPSNTLKLKVGKLILKSRLACSLPSLEPEEHAMVVEAWCEVLDGKIPENRLNDCYLYAMQHKETTFPLGAPELITAWGAIREVGVPRTASSLVRGDVCSRCNGTGTELIYVDELVASKTCDHVEFS